MHPTHLLTRHLKTAFAVTALLIAPLVHGQKPGDAATKPAKPPITKEVKDEVLAKINTIVTKAAYVPGADFAKWPDYLSTEKEEIDKATSEEQFAFAVQKAFGKFGFSHLAILPPRAAEARVRPSTVGIGIRIDPQPDGTVLVVSTVEGAPAKKAGIEPGDLIIEVDGKKTQGTTQIAGEEGTSVKIKVKKANGKIKEYTIVRAKFSTIRPEELAWADPDTAVIKIYTFDTGYDTARVEKLMTEASKAKRLIVDLRGNGGGAVVNMMHFLNMVLPPKSLVGTFISRRDVDNAKENGVDTTDLKAVAENAQVRLRTFKSMKVAPFAGSVSVLVDAGSGSAAEISAAAIKEVLNGPVVGTKSAGAVLVSTIVNVGEGFALQYPMFDYLTAKGIRLEGNGVTPDVVADKTPIFLKAGEKDPAWAVAVGLLKKSEQAKL